MQVTERMFDENQRSPPSSPSDSTEKTNKTKETKATTTTKRQWAQWGLSRRLFHFFAGIRKALVFNRPFEAVNPLSLGAKPCSGQKQFAFTETVSLNRIKAIKNSFEGDVSINDVLLAVLTISIQRYFQKLVRQGEQQREEPNQRQSTEGDRQDTAAAAAAAAKKKSKILTLARQAKHALETPGAMHGLIPVNARAPGSSAIGPKGQIGNNIASSTFAFPLDEKDPIRMVWRIQSMIDTFKYSPLVPMSKTLSHLAIKYAPQEKVQSVIVENGFTLSLSLAFFISFFFSLTHIRRAYIH